MLELRHLRVLDLSKNNFSAKIPNFISLAMLLMQSSSSLFIQLKSSTSLQTLDISYNDMSNSTISGSIPTIFWTNMTSSMMYLNLSMNGLHDIVPNLPFQFSYPSLIELKCFIRSNTVFLVRSKFRVSILDLSDNCLASMLPPWFELHKMKSVYMQSNNLSRLVPSPIGSPSCDLYLLSLCNNSFSGPLPQWLRKCTGLQILDISTNNISGFVPSWIGENMIKMVSITLQINNLKILCQLENLGFVSQQVVRGNPFLFEQFH
ncbi:LOW QUALITY PROTEIN: hypothetical protein V2J09_004270 [Rumex salicifolius]